MSKGVLPFDELKHQVTLNTGFFETSRYTEDEQMFVTAGNFDDAGMSGGNLQYNFGWANRLTELYQYMINNHEQICIDAFGANTTEYNTWKTACLSPNQQDRLDFGELISTPKDGSGNDRKYIVEPYKTALGTIQISPECKAKYYQMRDDYYWGLPYDLFRQLSCTSRLALASLFDLYINKGRYYPINLIQVDFDRIDADTTIDDAEKERQKIYQLNHRGNEEENALNDTSSLAFDDRRYAIANQGGNYFGATYDPDVQFDMNQEPAISEKTSTIGVNLGSIAVDNVYIGNMPVDSIYLGANLVGGMPEPYITSKIPQTQFRTNPNHYDGIGDATTAITLTAGQPIWIDVENFVACRTYYTIDGSTPTTASTLYDEAIILNASCTLKVLTVSIFGVAEAVKTLNVTIATAPTTTISPAATVQNSIPITITLSTSEAGAAIYYRLGTSATVYTYTAPFTVNQTSAGVQSPQIKITYWAVGAAATEPEKSIIYDTSGAIPSQPVVLATAGNNQIALDWEPTLNTTSYNVYRSEAAGTIGTLISQWQTPTAFTDTTAVNGITYFYTVRASNYQNINDSAQVQATPEAPEVTPTGYRYLRIDGFGEYYTGAGYNTTRLMEIEVFSGGINRAAGKLGSTEDAVDFPTGTADYGKTTGIAFATNGDKSLTNYDGWWGDITLNGNSGNGFLKIDLGAEYPIESMRYWSYSSRSPRFKIWGTNNLADFGTAGAVGAGAVLLWDESLNNGIKVCGATAGTNNYIEKVF